MDWMMEGFICSTCGVRNQDECRECENHPVDEESGEEKWLYQLQTTN